MKTDLITRGWEQLRDWVFDNYRTAYMVGMWTIIYTATFPAIHYTVVLWLISLAVGWMLEPCLDPQNLRYGKAMVEGKQGLALTFDDGPSPPVTAQLLDLLARENVKATFFLIGESASRHPELVRRMAAEGHLVGNHTQTHPNLLTLSKAAGHAELETGGRSIASALGEPPRYFRPPFGFRYPWTFKSARSLGQEPVLWSLNPRDFHDPGVDVIVQRVLEGVKVGSIILLHDGPENREQTLEAVARLIPALRERGFEFVRLDEM